MKNTTKTIVFASLIAAMILPFSGMNFAEAQEQTTHDESDRKTIAELKKRILSFGATNQALTEQENHELKQYKLVLKWFNAEGNDERQDKIQQEISTSFPNDSDYTEAVEITEANLAGTYLYIPYTGSTEKNYNCETQSDDLGNAHGSLTVYPNTNGAPHSGYSYWLAYMNYPDHTSNPVPLGCADDDWDHSTAKITSLTTTATCKITTFSSSTDAELKKCDDIEGGLLVAIEGNSFYDSGNELIFSPHSSVSYKYLS